MTSFMACTLNFCLTKVKSAVKSTVLSENLQTARLVNFPLLIFVLCVRPLVSGLDQVHIGTI